jgi:hypothetical protein
MGAAEAGGELQGRTGHLNKGDKRRPTALRRDARADVSDDDRTEPLPGHPEVLSGLASSLV